MYSSLPANHQLVCQGLFPTIVASLVVRLWLFVKRVGTI